MVPRVISFQLFSQLSHSLDGLTYGKLVAKGVMQFKPHLNVEKLCTKICQFPVFIKSWVLERPF